MAHFRAAADADPNHLGVRQDVAIELRELGRLDEAEAAFREVVAKNPSFCAGWHGLGVIARRRGDREGALAHFRAAADADPNHLGVRQDIANELRELGRLDEAEAAFREVVAKNPSFCAGWHGLGVIARRRGDREGALAHFRAAADADPNHLGVRQDIANELRELGRLDEAEAAFREVVAKNPSFCAGWHGLGVIARRRGDREGALAHFRAAADADPNHLGVRQDIANELRELGRLDEAEAVCRKIVAKNPRFLDGWRGLGLIARCRGDREAALAHFRAAADADPNHLWARQDVATELCQLGHFDEAEAVCRKIVAKNPRFPDGWRGLGLIARRRGDREAALAHFRAAADADPNHPWARQDVATELRELGYLDEAEAVYREMVAKNPRLSDGWRGLGLIARRRGDSEAALAHFRAAAEADPKALWAFEAIATELRELGRLDEAEEVLESIVARNPDSAQALTAYANGIRHKASKSELVAMFEKAVALEPGHISARHALASEYLWNYRLDEAEALHDEILSRERNPGSLIGKGLIARQRGDRAAALDFFAEAAKSPGATAQSTIEWSTELFDAGRNEEAQKVLLDALSQRPNQPNIYMRLGHNARARGDHLAAREAFSQALKLNSKSDPARIELATEEFHQGRTSQAVAALEEIILRQPKHVRAIETLARFLEQLDDLERATYLRRKVLEIEPSNLAAHLNIARALAKFGQIQEARQALANAAARLGRRPEIVLAEAGMFNNFGDYAAAHALLTKASAEFPTHFEVRNQLARSMIFRGEFERARRAADAVSAHNVRDKARLCALRAEIAIAEWDFDAAERHFADALAFWPSEPSINGRAAQVALYRFDLRSAKQRLETSMRFNPVHRNQHQGKWKTSQSYVGQLLDEFRIDRGALDKLRDALPRQDAIQALANLVREMPDYTPAAMFLTIALRRKGLLARSECAACKAPSIPAKILQFWDDEIPADVGALCEAWRASHPTYSYQLFSLRDARRFLSELGFPGALAAFNRAIEPAMKADLFRLAYLFREGGYYIDADDRFLAPLSTLNTGGHDLVLYQEEYGTAGNNFIGARPGHPAIERALKAAIDAVNRGDHDMVWLATGPGLLTRSIASYLAEDVAKHLKTTLILERHELRQAVAIHTLTSHKNTKKHWVRSAFNRARALSIESLETAIRQA
ncbi:tetratricopeptide repeat protein [Rhodoblastus acidophilus]|uniref:Tetratricopeptide repeat protein n=2 Tax=Candidatus Rhodoblastus alkanivorans TaxID=2954117 RepID=A0ABS9Z8H7_9HYPH|nr:tetratricopeptide repeat protein [Candidatus Rhodoblastus alkanivorans]